MCKGDTTKAPRCKGQLYCSVHILSEKKCLANGGDTVSCGQPTSFSEDKNHNLESWDLAGRAWKRDTFVLAAI